MLALNQLLAASQNTPAALAMIAGVIVVIVAVGLIANHFERRRLQALEAVAANLGLSFEPAGDRALSESFGTFPLFSVGRRRRAAGLMSGPMPRFGHAAAGSGQLLVFDYRYTTGSGKHSHTHRQTVAAIQLTGRALPRFALRPENIWHRIGGVFGYQDIDFESAPQFSRKWLVRGDDEQAVRVLFGPLLIEALEPLEPLCIEAGGDWIVVYRASQRVQPENIELFLTVASQIAASLLRHSSDRNGRRQA